MSSYDIIFTLLDT